MFRQSSSLFPSSSSIALQYGQEQMLQYVLLKHEILHSKSSNIMPFPVCVCHYFQSDPDRPCQTRFHPLRDQVIGCGELMPAEEDDFIDYDEKV